MTGCLIQEQRRPVGLGDLWHFVIDGPHGCSLGGGSTQELLWWTIAGSVAALGLIVLLVMLGSGPRR